MSDEKAHMETSTQLAVSVKWYQRHRPWLLLAVVVAWAAGLRFYGLGDFGLRNCDEGTHLFLSQILVYAEGINNYMYFKHGLIIWRALGVLLFGPLPTDAIAWTAFCGVLTLLPLFAFLRFVFDDRIALLTALIFASSRYVFFYHRSNLSNGHALLLFVTLLLLLYLTLWGFGFLDREVNDQCRRFRLPLLGATGLLIGVSFTVRVPCFFAILGTIGAFGLSLLLTGGEKRWHLLRRYTGLVSMLGVLALGGYLVTMKSVAPYIDWPRTFEWYQKNVAIAGGDGANSAKWQPHMLDHLWSYCSPIFLLLVLVGLAWECRGLLAHRHRERLWVWLCAVGLAVASFKVGMPWPRAHLFVVFFFTIYWAVALARFVGDARNSGRRLAALAVILVTVAAEFWMIYPFYSLSHGYRQANGLMLSRDQDGRRKQILGTHSWSIMSCTYGNHGATTIYNLVDEPVSYGKLVNKLRKAYSEAGIRFMVLDLYLSYTKRDAPLTQALQQLALSVPPDGIFANELANEAQNVADAFENSAPRHDIFSQFVVVYDLKRLAEEGVPNSVARYTSDADMLRLFCDRYNQPLPADVVASEVQGRD